MATGLEISTKLQIGEVRGRHVKGEHAKMNFGIAVSGYCFLCQYQ